MHGVQMFYFYFFAGMLIGVLTTLVLIFKKVDAILAVNRMDPERDKYNFIILCPLDDIHKKKYMVVQVKESK